MVQPLRRSRQRNRQSSFFINNTSISECRGLFAANGTDEGIDTIACQTAGSVEDQIVYVGNTNTEGL